MEIEQLLQDLAQALGQESLAFNESGVLSLRFGDDIVIHLEPDPDEEHCHLYSVLCRVPESADSRHTIMEALMTANTFGKGTAGAAFGLDEQQNEFVLTRTFVIQSTQSDELFQWLQDTVSVMDIWQRRLPELVTDEVPDTDMPWPSREFAYAIRV